MPLKAEAKVDHFIQSRAGTDNRQANGSTQRPHIQRPPQPPPVQTLRRDEKARIGFGHIGLERRAAEGLKVELPQTSKPPQKPNMPDFEEPQDIAGLAVSIALQQLSPIQQERQARGTFDDTASHLTLDSESTDDEQPNGQRERYYAYGASDYNRDPASNSNLKHVSKDHAMQMRGEILPAGPERSPSDDIHLESNWPDVVADEKFRWRFDRRQMFAHNSTAPWLQDHEEDDYDKKYEVEINEDDYQQFPIGTGAGTPTRSDNVAVNIEHPYYATANVGKPYNAAKSTEVQHSGAANSPKPALVGSNIRKPAFAPEKSPVKNTNTATNMGPPPSKNTANIATATQVQNKQLTMPQVPAKTTRFISSPDILQDTKASSYNGSTSSEEDFPIPKPSTSNRKGKCPLSGTLDFPIDAMKSMSYADLDGPSKSGSTSFLTDPSQPPVPIILNAAGQPLSTAQRLENMAKMKEEDIIVMFQSFDDSQNEETAKWFQEMMFQDMKALMAAKLERRKLVYKYEYEARQREAEVRAKMADVDAESGRLRGGLASLMQSKDLAETTDTGVDAGN